MHMDGIISYNEREIEIINQTLIAFLTSLNSEIDRIKKKKKARLINLAQGKLISKDAKSACYEFVKLDSAFIPDDCEALIEIKGRDSCCEYLFTKKNKAYINIFFENPHYQKKEIPEAVLKIDLTFLLKKLQDCIKDLFKNSIEENIGYDLILKKIKHIDPMKESNVQYKKLNQSQENALTKSRKYNIFFIWGPPGTGKTQTIGALIHDRLQQNKKVLLLSHSNMAVDEALEKYLDTYSDSDQSCNRIVRLGLCYKERIKEKYPSVLLDNILIDKIKPFNSQYQEFIEHEAILSNWLEAASENEDYGNKKKCIDLLLFVREEISKIEQTIKGLKKDICENADLLATTLTKTFSSPDFPDHSFDTVIIDEASMASYPYVFWALTKASKQAIIVGDFKQLPPIAVDDNLDNDLRKNVYSKYMGNSIEKADTMENLVLLDTQYRMNPGISYLSNGLFYDHYLKNHDSTNAKLLQEDILSGSPLSIIDTSTLKSFSYPGFPSRVNFVQAVVTSEIAKNYHQVNPDASIGVITPYRKHANYILSIVRDANLIDQVEVNTIHSFQGGEKDLILLDLADSGRNTNKWTMFNETQYFDAPYLINVALTRAKAKLIIVLDVELFYKYEGTYVKKIIDMAYKKNSSKISLRKVFSILKDYKHNNYTYFYDDIMNKQFREDLFQANEEITFCIKDSEFSVLLREALKQNDLIKPGLKYRCIKHSNAKFSFTNPLFLNSIQKDFVHENMIIIDNKVLWVELKYEKDGLGFLRFKAEKENYKVISTYFYETDSYSDKFCTFFEYD